MSKAFMHKRRTSKSRRPLILAIIVLVLVFGLIIYFAFGPAPDRPEQDAAVVGLFVRQWTDGPKPFRIDVNVANVGEREDEILVNVNISPADLDGSALVGPVEGTVLRPGQFRTVSFPFNPDQAITHNITAVASFKEPNGTEDNTTDNQGRIFYPPNAAYHWRARLTIEILRGSSPPENIPVPAGIGVAGGLWVNHTLDDWGVAGRRAPVYTVDSTQDPEWNVHVEPAVQFNGAVRRFTLGELFDIWGQELTDQCIKIVGYVDSCADGGQLIMEVNTLLVPFIKDHVVEDGEDMVIEILY